MSSLKVALVTQRYWPVVGGPELTIANLAEEFQRSGVEATVVTARFQKDWPSRLIHRNVPVVRLPYFGRGGLATLRYLNSLAKWLRDHHRQFDLVMVSTLQYEAYVTMGALQRVGVPVVLRAAAGGLTGDCAWHRTARFGRRVCRRCQTADAIIAPSVLIESELRDAGFRDARIFRVANGATWVTPRDKKRRAVARRLLGKAHELLAIADDALLVVYVGPFAESMGMRELIYAWQTVSARWPRSRLWLLGDGPFGLRMWKIINRLGLTDQIIMPGMFDDLTDVFYAADLFVQPSHDEGQSTSVLDAVAAALPVVATNTKDSQELFNGHQQDLIHPRDSGALAEAIQSRLANYETTVEHALAMHRHLSERHSMERTAGQYLRVFENLLSADSDGRLGRTCVEEENMQGTMNP